jgi:hypothetical protein
VIARVPASGEFAMALGLRESTERMSGSIREPVKAHHSELLAVTATGEPTQ